jgi:hypothetical protein
MPAITQQNPKASQVYLIYDRPSGRVLGRFRRVSFAAESGEADSAAILDLFRNDSSVLRRLTNGDPKNLAVLLHRAGADSGTDADVRRLHVSAKRQAVEPLPSLRLRSDRDALKGDGQDSVAIQVDVVDEQGRILRKFQGKLIATTSRGKLSEPGGNIRLKNGQATFNLTSTAETVSRVLVRVRDPNGGASSDSLVFRFD